MERRYDLLGISFGTGKSERYLPQGKMEDAGSAREALRSVNAQGRFELGGYRGRIKSVRVYDRESRLEKVIPYAELQKDSESEIMLPDGSVINRSQLFEDLCTTKD